MKRILSALLCAALMCLAPCARAALSPADVFAAQTALNAAGYDCGQPDGIAGRRTQAAAAAFQADRGLTVTGALTVETLAALGLAEPAEEGEVAFPALRWDMDRDAAEEALREAGLLEAYDRDPWNGGLSGYVLSDDPDDILRIPYSEGYRDFGVADTVALKSGALVEGAEPSYVSCLFIHGLSEGEADAPNGRLAAVNVEFETDDADALIASLADALSGRYGEPVRGKRPNPLFGEPLIWFGANDTAVCLVRRAQSSGDLALLVYGRTFAAAWLENIRALADS